jgi:hypothetical protein
VNRTHLRYAALAILLVLSSATRLFAQPPSPTAATPPPETPGLLPEPSAISKGIAYADRKLNRGGEPRDGFYPEFGNMITGSGWISVGPGYRHHVLNRQARIDASGAISWNLYRMAQVHFEFPYLAKNHLLLGAQAIYQDMLRVNYFGFGDATAKADRSGYRLKGTDFLGYAQVNVTPSLAFNGRLGTVRSIDVSAISGRHVTYPSTVDVFNEITAPGLTQQPNFLHADVSAVGDTRNHPGHPTRGGLYRVTAAAYSDRDAGKYSFRRYELEGAQFVPLAGDRWVIALHGWEVFSDTSSSSVVPFYLMPSLGGKNTLRGHMDYRFHDRNMQSFSAESRWALFTHLDAAIFADFGKVAPNAGGLNFKDLKTSYGAGIRLHNREYTFGRLDIGRSVEGWRILLQMSDPFKRSTLSGSHTAVIPFVP